MYLTAKYHISITRGLYFYTSLRTKCLEMFYSLPTSQIWKQDVTALDYLFFRFKCLSCYALWIYTKPLVNFLLYHIAVTLYRSWYWQAGNVIERWTQQKVVLNYKPNRTRMHYLAYVIACSSAFSDIFDFFLK